MKLQLNALFVILLIRNKILFRKKANKSKWRISFPVFFYLEFSKIIFNDPINIKSYPIKNEGIII